MQKNESEIKFCFQPPSLFKPIAVVSTICLSTVNDIIAVLPIVFHVYDSYLAQLLALPWTCTGCANFCTFCGTFVLFHNISPCVIMYSSIFHNMFESFKCPHITIDYLILLWLIVLFSGLVSHVLSSAVPGFFDMYLVLPAPGEGFMRPHNKYVNVPAGSCWLRVLCAYILWGRNEIAPTQIAKIFESISVRHRSDKKVLDQCLIDVDLRVFDIWEFCRQHFKMHLLERWCWLFYSSFIDINSSWTNWE